MKKIKFFLAFVGILIFSGTFVSCSDNNPENSEETKKASTLLIYAVATNSLTNNLVYDKNEMLASASEINLNKYNVLLFETQYQYLEDNTRTGNVRLLKLSKDLKTDVFTWETVREFNDGVASLNPSRMSEVINYVVNNYPSEKYGLVLWSHSTGAQPYVTNYTSGVANTSSESSISVSLPSIGWFGQDLSISEDEYKYMNIDVLADILPDHLFDYIWFDSCYMSNIESIYQLRNKCNTYVAYPTEVIDSGLPYQYTLPYMIGDKENLIEAAKAFYDYYSNSFGTVAVVDMTKIDILADFCKSIFTPGVTVPGSSLVKFSRYSTGPFYDLGDYVKTMSILSDNPVSEDEWNAVLDQCVTYKATTDGRFLNLSINPDTFSGISTHLYSFDTEDNVTETYYKSLDWFQSVF